MITIGFVSIPEQTVKIILLFLSAILIHQIAFRILMPFFKKMAKKTKFVWDDVFIKRKVLKRAFHLLPATVLSFELPLVLDQSADLYAILTKAIVLYYITAGFILLFTRHSPFLYDNLH